MSQLTDRYPMLPRLKCTSNDPDAFVKPYVNWKLLEFDSATGEVMICEPCSEIFRRTQSKHLKILCGRAAESWLRYHDLLASR